MATIYMSDATTKTVNLASQQGFVSMYRDIASNTAVKLELSQKHTLAGSDAFSQDRHLITVVRKRVDSLVSKEAVVGANFTVYKSNHSLITATDVYDVVNAVLAVFTQSSTAMSAGTKAQIDKFVASTSVI